MSLCLDSQSGKIDLFSKIRTLTLIEGLIFFFKFGNASMLEGKLDVGNIEVVKVLSVLESFV